MANTFELISSVTVGSGGAATMVFSSIPSTYTDLCLKISARDTNAGYLGAPYNDISITVNSQSSASGKVLYTINGTSAASYSPSALTTADNSSSSTANTFSNVEYYIPNYLSTGVKSMSADTVIENNATAANLNLAALSVTNGAAINTITITAATSFVQYSTAYLYGVKNA